MGESLDRETEAKIASAIDAVWVRRKDRVLERVDLIIEVASSLEDGSADSKRITAARMEAHRLAGALGSFGFPAASEMAAEIETLLEDNSGAVNHAKIVAETASSLRKLLEKKPGS